MTRFKSFWNKPTEAAKNEVNEPIIETMIKIDSLFSNKMEQRIIKKTPETTKVAAWIKAETGVGPSIASGNQICNPNCADLPKTPQKSKKEITVKTFSSKFTKVITLSITHGTSAKIVA